MVTVNNITYSAGKDIGKNLQTGRFSVSLPPCQKEANYIQEINTTGNDFSLLTENYPPLKKFVQLNPYGYANN